MVGRCWSSFVRFFIVCVIGVMLSIFRVSLFICETVVFLAFFLGCEGYMRLE